MITYSLIKKDGNARRGRITTPHGTIETPVFMPVGTDGTVKAVTAKQVEETGSQIILANTYHLYLRPGTDVLDAYGGIHHFMAWDKSILTDSGGFQAYSLSGTLAKASDEGVQFISHIDGTKHFFSPEISMKVQHSIGADIIMAFDDLVKDAASREEAARSTERTLSWLDRCIHAWHAFDEARDQSLFGIIQGGVYHDIRREAAKRVVEYDLEGIAIGGESIGYNKEMTREIIDSLMEILPAGIPHYAMGVGDIDDIFEIVDRGIDMFDCVSPTRMARNGAVLISPLAGGSKNNKYRLNITKQIYAASDEPIDPGCACYTCRTYSRGYIRHLFHAHELLAYTLASIHNLTLLASLGDTIRSSIEEGTFHDLKKAWV